MWTAFLCTSFTLLLYSVDGQFPAVCAQNLTTELPTVCCPVPEGATEACGGSGRGLCREVTSPPEELEAFPLEERILLDDRLNWPSRFFRSLCFCQGNFKGYACHRCKTGWAGPNCTARRPPRIRRNVLTLTASEQRQFRNRINLSKRTRMTEWLALNISTSLNGDPVNLKGIQLVQVPSIYDYFVFLHVYASRSTLTMDTIWQSKCDPIQQKLDFAHKGTGFPTWHRAYVLFVEEELGRLGTSPTDSFSQRDGDNFALPYWDWTGEKGCSVCTTDLVGALSPSGQIQNESPFVDWITFCPQRPEFDDCHVCDPGLLWSRDTKSPMAGGPLWRKANDPKLAPAFARLPDQLDMDITLNCSDYDVWPYSMGAGPRSFRDLLEGFTDPKNGAAVRLPVPSGASSSEAAANQTNGTAPDPKTASVFNVPVHMHNLVHSYFNGSWFDVATSPNDPIFFLHHTFVDKVLELWIRKNRPSPEQYPKTNCPPGHGAYSALVPFIPVTTNIDYFVDSRSIGYDYDDYKAGTTVVVPAEGTQPKLAVTSTGSPELRVRNILIVTSTILGFLLVVVLCSLVVLLVTLARQRQSSYVAIKPPDLTDHHLAAMDTWRSAKYILPIRRYRTSTQDENAHLLSPTN